MDDAKSSYAVTQNHQSTAQEPQKLAIPSEQIKNTTEGKSIGQTASKPPYKPFTHLYCCLPKGETYTDQPYNKKAQNLEYRARSWVEANPMVWADWVHKVSQAARAATRLSCQLLAENARAFDLVDASGEPFKVNNDLRPALARLLCEEVPEACPYVELRTSVFERAWVERHEEAA